jgi:hypothetical protein
MKTCEINYSEFINTIFTMVVENKKGHPIKDSPVMLIV